MVKLKSDRYSRLGCKVLTPAEIQQLGDKYASKIPVPPTGKTIGLIIKGKRRVFSDHELIQLFKEGQNSLTKLAKAAFIKSREMISEGRILDTRQHNSFNAMVEKLMHAGKPKTSSDFIKNKKSYFAFRTISRHREANFKLICDLFDAPCLIQSGSDKTESRSQIMIEKTEEFLRQNPKFKLSAEFFLSGFALLIVDEVKSLLISKKLSTHISFSKFCECLPDIVSRVDFDEFTANFAEVVATMRSTKSKPIYFEEYMKQAFAKTIRPAQESPKEKPSEIEPGITTASGTRLNWQHP